MEPWSQLNTRGNFWHKQCWRITFFLFYLLKIRVHHSTIAQIMVNVVKPGDANKEVSTHLKNVYCNKQPEGLFNLSNVERQIGIFDANNTITSKPLERIVNYSNGIYNNMVCKTNSFLLYLFLVSFWMYDDRKRRN